MINLIIAHVAAVLVAKHPIIVSIQHVQLYIL